MTTDLATVEPHGLTADQQQAILKHLGLNPQSVDTQALLLICGRYGLDPLLKHVVLIQGRPYVTRDGYLAVAHRSQVLDGIEVQAEGEDQTHWWAKVAVYRKDMSKPFAYKGRYPKAEAKHMAKYGPEMAIKCAEVMALRRAFNVTGIGAADEQWDDHIEAVEVVLPERLQVIVARYDALPDDARQILDDWITDNNNGDPAHVSELPEGWWTQVEAQLDDLEPADSQPPKGVSESGEEVVYAPGEEPM